MHLRYTGECRECGAEIPKGEEGIYDRNSRSVRCVTCPSHAGLGSAVARETPIVDGAASVSAATGKRMRLRYAGVCRICAVGIATGEVAVYEHATRTVRCATCPADGEAPSAGPDTSSPAGPAISPRLPLAPPTTRPTSDRQASPGSSPSQPLSETAPVAARPIVDSGDAGASARREYERRRVRDEARTREKWGKLGGIAVALSSEKQTTKAWEKGAVGEERLGRRLDGAASADLLVLHDRRIPSSKANIDHIVVTVGGVWVVDAKRYKGRPKRMVTGGLLRPREETLLVGTRNCTGLVDSMHSQMGLVRGVVGHDVPVFGALCFVNADWPLAGGAFTIRGVRVLWPKRLVSELRRETGGPCDVEAIHRMLAEQFPPA